MLDLIGNLFALRIPHGLQLAGVSAEQVVRPSTFSDFMLPEDAAASADAFEEPKRPINLTDFEQRVVHFRTAHRAWNLWI